MELSASNATYVTQVSLFQPALDNARRQLAVAGNQLGSDDGSIDSFRRVDDLFDAGNSEGDVH